MTDAKGSEYLEWAKAQTNLPYSLAASGVPPCDVLELEPTLEDFAMTTDNEYGWPPLLQRIARRYLVEPENVVLAHGTSMANYLACAALLSTGDHVVIETPVYDPLVAVPRYLKCDVSFFNRSEEDRYALDIDRIKQALKPHTRLVIFSNLHNPSGAIATRAELEALAVLAESKSFYVLVDEVYLEWVYGEDSNDGAPIPLSAINLSPRIVTTRSLTKAYGLASLRAGWILAEETLAKKMLRLNGLFTSSMSHPAERLAAKALDRAGTLLNVERARVAANRELATDFVQSQPKLSWVPPHAGTVGFLRYDGNVEELVRRLRTRGSLVTPGRFFGVDDHFRIGFGMERSQLEGGLERLAQSL